MLQQPLHHPLSLKWLQSHQTTEYEILNAIYKTYFLIPTLFHFTTTVDEDGHVNRNARLLFYFFIIDEKCTCNKKTVTCKKKSLEAFPVNIPKDTVHLRLRENKISKIPQNGILNDLIYLESLDLSRNQLQYIPRKSFQHLKKLKNLKLGENNIKIITADNFYGLERLENLGLEINDMTNISRNNFKY